MGIRDAFRRRRQTARSRESDLDRELRTHLELEAEERSGAGVNDDEARRAARHALGNVTLIAEDARAVWRWTLVERLLQDVRYGLRLMRRSPVVSSVAVVSLALGIGANTAIFSVVDAVMLRPLPVVQPGELVTPSVDSGDGPAIGHWSYPQFVQLRDLLADRAALTVVSEIQRSNLEIAGAPDPAPVMVALVSGNYFSVFGVPAGQGRTFTADDDRVPGGHPVAMISDEYWQRRLGRASDVLGRTLKLNATTYTIVGVAPPRFTGDFVGHPVDVWVPAAMQSEVMVERPGLLTNPGPPWTRVVARPRPGVSRVVAEAAANAWFRTTYLKESNTGRPQSPAEIAAEARAHLVLLPAGRGYSIERADLGLPLAIVSGIVGLVLLIACANVANLLLARAAARRSEMGVRIALGAGRARLWRQLLTESVVLAACAGSLGAGLGASAMRAMRRFMASGPSGLTLDLHLDTRVLLFTAAVSLAAGLVFGLAPAFSVSSVAPSRTLGGRSDAGIGPTRFRFGKTLVVLQVAMSFVLLVSAMSFVRTLRHLSSQELGFDRAHTLIVMTAPSQEGLSGDAVASLMTRLQDRLTAVPGVLSAAAGTTGVLGGMGGGSPAVVPGYTYGPNEDNWIRWNIVTPRYFESMGIPIVAGRDFGSVDTVNAPRVAVINETMAKYYWGTTNVVGRRFGIRRDTGNEIEVVGVVNDAHLESLRDTQARTVYLPYLQDVRHLMSTNVVVQTAGPSQALIAAVRNAVREVDARLPITSLRTVDEQIDQALVAERLMAGLSASFGAVALLLTCLGLYGVLAYLTVRRRHEIGVRLALGASRGSVIGLVLGGSVWLLGLGLAIGAPAAWLLLRAASSLLFHVSASDVSTPLATSGILIAVGLLASYVPAFRATRVNPVTALRSE